MPKVNKVMPKVQPPQTPTTPKKAVKKDTNLIPGQTDYPILMVNGIAIPEKNLRITIAWAKKAVGWQTEADYFNWCKEKDPKVSIEACRFLDNNGGYLLEDEEKNKVRCWNNANNRPFYESWARSLAQDILNKHWHFNCETIIISRTGRVLSAQHRLVALILAGQMWGGKNHDFWAKKWPEEPYILSLVATGAEEDQDTVNTLDNVKPRSLSDVFFTSPIFANMYKDQRRVAARMLESAVNFLWQRTKPSREVSEGVTASDNKYQTHSTSAEFLDRHKKILEHINYMLKCNETKGISTLRIRPGVTAGCLYLQGSCDSNPDEYRENDPPSEKSLRWDLEKKAERFWEEICKDTAMFKPVREALKALVDPDSGEDGRIAEKLCVLAKAWALFVEDMPLSMAKLLPKYGKDKNDNTCLAEWPTFGGIDFGDPAAKSGLTKIATDDDGKEAIERRKAIEERRKDEERENSRKRMEERIRARTEKVKKGPVAVKQEEEE